MSNICNILREAKTIAVVGFSDKPYRDSREIALFLANKGYKVYGVNPTIDELNVDGIPIVKSLREIKEKIDIVDIFRRSEFVPEIVDEAIEIGAKIIWMQLGVINYEAKKKAEGAGIEVIMNRCIKIEYLNCFYE